MMQLTDISQNGSEGVRSRSSKQRSRSRELSRRNRRGILILEVVVACALLATLLVLINQVIVRIHAQARMVDQRIAAQQLLENAMEEIVSREWDDLKTENLEELRVPESVTQKLPDVTMTGTIKEYLEPVQAKKITLQLSWVQGHGRQIRPVNLTTWVYKRPEVEP